MNAVAGESKEDKLLCLLYLAFTTLRYFVTSTNSLLQEYYISEQKPESSTLQQVLTALKPQFQLLSDILAYLYKDLEVSPQHILLNVFGSAFGSSLFTNSWLWCVWINYCENNSLTWANSIYFKSIPLFYFNFYIEDKESVFDIINKRQFTVMYKNLKKMRRAIPFENYLYIKEISQNKFGLVCTVSLADDKQNTISDSSSLSVYYNQLKTGQNTTFCPEKYKNLGVQYSGLIYTREAEVYFSKNLYILLPNKVKEENFCAYIKNNHKTGTDAIVNAVLQAKQTINIIQYTYLHRQDKKVTHAIIEADYRRFLTEFVTARLEGDADTSSETDEDE